MAIAELGQEYMPHSLLTALRGKWVFTEASELCEQIKRNVTDGLCLLLLPPTCTIIEMLRGVRFNIHLSTSIFLLIVYCVAWRTLNIL